MTAVLLASFAAGALAQSGQYPNNTVAGNVSGAAGPVTPLSQAQLTTLCNLVTASLNGCAPAFPNNATTFFRGDGTYQQVTGNAFAAQSANTVFAGPTNGAAAAPTFRALIGSDIPVANGTSCPSNLQTYAPFANTTSAPTGTTLNIWDGSQCVPWATLNQTAHTLTLTGSTGSALAQALTINQTPAGSQSGSFNANSILVTSSAALSGASSFLYGLNMGCSAQTSTVQGGINCLQVATGLNSPTNASNANHNYVAVVGIGQANTGDGGTNTGGGAQGAVFGSNFIGNAVNGATNLLGVSGGEVDCEIQTGASSKLKMCWSIVSVAADAVHAASVDAGLTVGAQSGSIGFNNAIRFTTANGVYPVSSGGTLIASDAGTVTHGIDLSSVTFTADAYRSAGFSVNPTGIITATGEILIDGTSSGSGAITVSATGGTLQFNGTSATIDSAGNGTFLNLAITSTIFRTQTPATLTGTSGTINSSSQIINNAGGAFTLTLPSTAFTGQWLWIKATGTTTSVVSASSNVVPLTGGAAGTAILSAAGKWASLESDGTNWIIMAAN